MATATPSLTRKEGVFSRANSCKRKFLRAFPAGFQDAKYVAWERGYKWEAHERWVELLNQNSFRELLLAENFEEVASRATRIESRTNLLFSFEKMALRDGVRSADGARLFATGLYALIYGAGTIPEKFDRWCEVLLQLPRRQTRVLNWPVATVFGFLAQPKIHFFLKPNVTRRAAERYGLPFHYQSKPDGGNYAELLRLMKSVRRDLADMHPRDMIDIQSFLWVQGSDEYAE